MGAQLGGRLAVGLAVMGVAGALLAVASGCNGDPEVPETPVPDAGVEPPPPPPPPPPPAPVSGPCDPITAAALQAAIKGREKGDVAAGMKPEGVAGCEQLPPGGTFSLPLTLHPGRCYTIVAQALGNVSEVDVFLKPNFGADVPPLLAPFANTPLAQDQDTGQSATIGKGSQCFKNPFPIPGPVRIEVLARTASDSGPVAVQAYSK